MSNKKSFENIRAMTGFVNVQVDQSFPKLCAQNLLLVGRIKKDMRRGRPPILRKLSFKLRH